MQVMATLCLATNRGTVTVGRRQHSLPLSPGYTPLPQRIRIRGSHWPFFPFLSSFSSVQSLSRVRLCAIPRTAARQAFLSITNSESLLKLMSIQWMIKLNSPFVHVFKNPECGLHLQVDAYVVPCGKIPWYCELFTLSGAYPVSQSK